ncbi:MAG: hypothetical protein LBS04_06940 [Tannerellaceae bacterium]|nr:hypothetical protein [Tannerellaceae bacterium]
MSEGYEITASIDLMNNCFISNCLDAIYEYATGSQLDMAYPMLVGAIPDRLYASV